jgi:TctA family transporter
MRRAVILLTTLALSGVFLFLPEETTPRDYFLYSDQLLELDTYVYFLFEHLILVILALLIWELEPKFRISVTAFLVIQIIDILDYVLFYGEAWSPYLPSWNILKVAFMGLGIAYDVKRHGKED